MQVTKTFPCPPCIVQITIACPCKSWSLAADFLLLPHKSIMHDTNQHDTNQHDTNQLEEQVCSCRQSLGLA